MKRTIIFTLSLLLALNTFAQSNMNFALAEQTYRKALDSLENNDYGKALKYSEDAILYKKEMVENQLKILNNSLSARRVKAVGDNINSVLKILNERNEFEAIKIIQYYIKKYDIENFDSSISKLIEFISGTKVYPEAQKLIGDIYKLEGEYEYAESYYKMALDNKDYLDIPDEKYEILYMLADISRLSGNDNQMEVRLLNILTEDSAFKDTALKNSILRTIKANKADSVEKFFILHRADNYYSLKAYNELSQYYYKKNDQEKALLYASLFCLTSFTKIYETLKLRNFDYEYKDLKTFFQECSYHNDILTWGSENQIWKSFNTLAAYTSEFGYVEFSKSLLKILVLYSPERYWQQEAVIQLQKLDPKLQ